MLCEIGPYEKILDFGKTYFIFERIISDMSKSMQMFSLSMRSLYVKKTIGTKAEAAVKLRKLRDDTRNDAMVYLRGILSLSTKFVSSISEYFEYYDALEFDEWCETLFDILEETIGYIQLCETLLQMKTSWCHLRRDKTEQSSSSQSFKAFKKNMKKKKKKKKFEESAQSKESWVFGLSFVPLVPVVGVIANHVLKGKVAIDVAEAVAVGAQAAIQEAAAIAVRDTLIPALEGFIDDITKAAGFFPSWSRKFASLKAKQRKAPNRRWGSTTR